MMLAIANQANALVVPRPELGLPTAAFEQLEWRAPLIPARRGSFPSRPGTAQDLLTLPASPSINVSAAMIPTTLDRVPLNTSSEINAQIGRATTARVDQYTTASAAKIDARLAELAAEWDIERAIEANASSIMLGGVALGALVDRRYLALPALVAGFLLQHAIQGWCPPVPILRRMGFRTQAEIDEERYALKALRGDFDLGQRNSALSVMAAVRR
jgi:hypothetical protein